MLKKRIALLACLAVIAVPATASTDEITLKAIMQELRQDFLDISDGFLLEDFDKVAEIVKFALGEDLKLASAK